MKLNPGIVFDRLQADMRVEMSGNPGDGLSLERAVVYAGDEKGFLPNVLYIALADRLPQRPALAKGTAILCVGETMQASHYRERCCFMQIREKADFFHIVNLVQDVFGSCSRWNEALLEILSSTASIREMLERSYGVFGNPLFVIDSDFRPLASAGYDEKIPQSTMGSPITVNNLDLPTMTRFLELHELSTDVREPMLMNLLDSSTLNTNLFNSGGEYIGCLTVDYRLRPHQASDIPLAKHLAGTVVQALQKLSAASTNERTTAKRALQDLVGGLPTTAEQDLSLESIGRDRHFACIKVSLSNRYAPLPADYVCTEIERVFPKGIAFEHDSSIVGFVEAGGQGGCSDAEALREAVEGFVGARDMQVGVSDPFVGLMNARLSYRQASAALESGSLLHPDHRYYAFQDLALGEMVMNMIDEFPVEMYYSPGLWDLLAHDREAPISYIETLQAYLDENMNVSRAAAALYVHRSTLLERIARIERILGSDLRDPDERLRILVLLKAMQVTDQIRKAPKSGS